jgi:hypothetical protein
MLIQIALLQRFSIYLGHPTYTLSIILFSMLLFTGLGSLASDRLDLRTNGLFRFVPLLIAITVVGWIVADQPVMCNTPQRASSPHRRRPRIQRTAIAPVGVLLSYRSKAQCEGAGPHGMDVGRKWRLGRPGIRQRRSHLDVGGDRYKSVVRRRPVCVDDRAVTGDGAEVI